MAVKTQVVEDQEIENAVDQLDEFKADGEASSVAEPVAGQTPTRRADQRKGETAPIMQGTSKVSKAAMLKQMVEKLSQLKDTDLKAAYKGVMNTSKQENPGEKPIAQGTTDIKQPPRVTKEDLDIASDLAAIFAGDETLSAEFKTQATEVFETAVVSKINEHLEDIFETAETSVETMTESAKEELSTKLDSYLDYVVEQWMDDNKLAVDRGIRAEIVENFMGGLRNLFVEHYVDIPEDKVDVVDDLVVRVEELESALSEQIDVNVTLVAENEDLARSRVLSQVTEGLTETQAEKITYLSEAVTFDSSNDFQTAVEGLKESYFAGGTVRTIVEEDDIDGPVGLAEAAPEGSAQMKPYIDAITRSLGAPAKK